MQRRITFIVALKAIRNGNFFHLAVRAAHELGIHCIPLIPNRLHGEWDLSLLGYGAAGGLLIESRKARQPTQDTGMRGVQNPPPKGRTAEIRALEKLELDRAKIIEKLKAHKPDIIVVPHYEYENLEPHLKGYNRIITVE